MATVLLRAPRPDGPDFCSADCSSGSSFTLSSSFTASSSFSSKISKFSFRLSSTIFLLSGFNVILGCWIFSSSKSNSGSFLARSELTVVCRLGRGEALGLSCVGEMESKTLLMGWSTPTQKGLPSDPEWPWHYAFDQWVYMVIPHSFICFTPRSFHRDLRRCWLTFWAISWSFSLFWHFWSLIWAFWLADWSGLRLSRATWSFLGLDFHRFWFWLRSRSRNRFWRRDTINRTFVGVTRWTTRYFFC